MNIMKLVEALEIFKKYRFESFDLSAQHDVVYMGGPKQSDVTEDDLSSLAEVGVTYSQEYDSWQFFT